jgi:hypothetical protein
MQPAAWARSSIRTVVNGEEVAKWVLPKRAFTSEQAAELLPTRQY